MGHKAETAALWESHSKAAALETKTHMLSIKEQQQDFLTQLGLVRDHINIVLCRNSQHKLWSIYCDVFQIVVISKTCQTPPFNS